MRPQYHSPRLCRLRMPDDRPEPVGMHWRCEACGHEWSTVTAILPRALGCPECGGKARVAEEGET